MRVRGKGGKDRTKRPNSINPIYAAEGMGLMFRQRLRTRCSCWWMRGGELGRNLRKNFVKWRGIGLGIDQ